MVGESGLDDGFYDVIFKIALVAIVVTCLDYGLRRSLKALRPKKHRWGFPVVNVFLGFGLIGLSAIPWAHFNVDDPMADRIYFARSLIMPSDPSRLTMPTYPYDINPAVWRCSEGPCDGDRKNTVSTYHHRHLPLSYRFLVYADCMSPEFNLATARAIGADLTDFDGDRRRIAHAFFDQEGRFIGPRYKWFDTPLMRTQLSTAEQQPSSVSFDSAITELAIWGKDFYRSERSSTRMDWSDLSQIIQSGNVEIIYRNAGVEISAHLSDGSELRSTQTNPSDLDALLTDCGERCAHIQVLN